MTTSAPQTRPADLPPWAQQLVTLYESDATNQFILYGNVNDRIVLPMGARRDLGSLNDFLLRVLMPRFDVILSYDLGNGIRTEKGEKLFQEWSELAGAQALPRQPKPAIETLTHYFRYVANLGRLNRSQLQVGCILNAANLVAPNLPAGLNYDLSALLLLIRSWSAETLLTDHTLATFLITENLNDLHPILVNNLRTVSIKIPLPSSADLTHAIDILAPAYPAALSTFKNNLPYPAQQLAGVTLCSVESLLKTRENRKQPIVDSDLAKLKKELVEKDCSGLIEFVESSKTLDDLHGQDAVKRTLRQDAALWKQNDTAALPMGYLLCGPVGTGKTYMAECLAGEASVPMVKLKNFRDKWVGSTEGNLEKIFRLLHALGRCYVFIDEADQALGRRDAGSNDSGVSGRVYSMIAEEMSNSANRGKIIWILASSRPDLIEVDLKRPGRIDVKIPIFPTTTPDESLNLLQALCQRKGLLIPPDQLSALRDHAPLLLTPGAAEALAIKVYRTAKTNSQTSAQALQNCLEGYQSPIPPDIMQFQINLAISESTDPDFIPPTFRKTTPVT